MSGVEEKEMPMKTDIADYYGKVIKLKTDAEKRAIMAGYYNVSKVLEQGAKVAPNITVTMVAGSDTFKFDLRVKSVLVDRFDTMAEAIDALRGVEEDEARSLVVIEGGSYS